jgi:MutS domain V
LNTKQVRLAALERQIRRLDSRITALRGLSDRWSRVRLLVFFAGTALAFAAFYAVGAVLFWSIAAATLLTFGFAVRNHRQINRCLADHLTWRDIKTTHVARMKLDWDHVPVPLPVTDDPIAVDLDLSGDRSLHHLIDTALSYEGSQRVLDWLLNSEPNEPLILQRQALVRELMRLSVFRDRLILYGTLAAGHVRQWRVRRLLDWFERQLPVASLRPTLLALSVMAAINLLLFSLYALGQIPGYWTVSLVIYLIVYSLKIRAAGEVFGDAMSLRDALNRLCLVFRYLETYHYADNHALKSLCAPFLDPTNRPSSHLRRITLIASAASLRNNPILAMALNLAVPWDLFFAHLLNREKIRMVALLPGWLEVWFELEALSSLACFGYLNPDFCLPQIIPERIFEASAIGHPLIVDAQKVTNDFTLDGPGRIVIITGSNMAGKSTFLRTLGVNLCLAYAGAPVSAAELRTGLFHLFTCVRISDSVTNGFSYFYAEVSRLRALLTKLEQADDLPLFFLIDEIFRGTNNRERLIGSRSYIRALVGRNGLGVIATHDLELVRLADENTHIVNNHFREDVIDGQMVFDYKLRPGPCPTTNALKIMRLAGLPVDAEPQPDRAADLS